MSELFPSLIFFIGVLIAFAAIEFIIVSLIDYIATHYLAFFIDQIIRLRVHYGRAIQWGFFIVILGAVVLLLVLTPVWRIVRQSTPLMKWFAFALFIEVFLIYFFTSKKIVRLKVERLLHFQIFALVSLVAYVFILLMAYESYGNYQAFLKKGLVQPTAERTETFLNERENKKRVTGLYEAYKNQECLRVDAMAEPVEPFRHYVHLGNDSEYLSGRDNPDLDFLFGWRCEKDNVRYWRTDNGKWYEIATDPLPVTN